MEQEDFMLTLYDRLNVIRDTINKYGEDKFYLSFSGGKDSTALHYLIDEALPGNTIPRVFINTGIEYTDIFKFVKQMSEKDDRFEMITVGKHIKHTLDEKGYPFKSKEHSNKLSIYQHIGNDSKTVARYLDKNNTFGCTDKLRYQFEPDFDIKISDYCCKEFKKYPARRYERRTGRSPILGLRRQEGGATKEPQRMHSCKRW